MLLNTTYPSKLIADPREQIEQLKQDKVELEAEINRPKDNKLKVEVKGVKYRNLYRQTGSIDETVIEKDMLSRLPSKTARSRPSDASSWSLDSARTAEGRLRPIASIVNASFAKSTISSRRRNPFRRTFFEYHPPQPKIA